MTDKDILISDLNDISEILNNNGYCGWCKSIQKAIALLKEQEEEISNYKETIENLLQQLQDIGKYMTPFGMVSDVRAYVEGRSQPEIIRCYACKHGEKCNSVYLCGKSRGFGIAHDPSWFCADGERR